MSLDEGNLFMVTDQRGKRWYIAAPTPEKAAAWLRENGRDTSLVINNVPIHVRTIGYLSAVVEPREGGTTPRIPDTTRREK